jgi:DNA repair protein RadD
LRALLRAGKKAPVIVAPTGAGKTTIAADLIESATAKGANIFFVAHRRELIEQCSKRLDSVGVDHGIIKAQHPRRRPHLRVQVCSIQTLCRREKLPHCDILFIDEAHRATANSYRQVIGLYPKAIIVGLTATPVRTDGQGLGQPGGLFDSMVCCPSIGDLTDRGYLVPTRVFAPSKPNLKGVHTIAGDYKNDELAAAVDKPKLVGDIVDTWRRRGEDRQTVCFAVNVEHSKHITSEFMRAGIPAMHLDANTPDDERDEILESLAAGRIRIVSNVGILTEGWDQITVSCCILARPTQSLTLYLQSVGRVLRPIGDAERSELLEKYPFYGLRPRKQDAIILDHAGLTLMHGFADEDREWSLDGTWKTKKAGDRPELSVCVCKRCWLAFSTVRPTCPACGWERPKQKREVSHEAGELQEVVRGARTREQWQQVPEEKRRSHYQRLVEEARARGYKPGWPMVRYKAVYGHWPPKKWKEQPAEAVA